MTENEYNTETSRLRNRLLITARYYLGSTAFYAEDIVQEVFIRMWQQRDNISVPADSFAFILVRNMCIDKLRKIKREAEACSMTDFSPDSNIQLIEKVISAAETLSPTLQNIFTMRHIEGKEITEIASVTGNSLPAIRKALSRARMAIKDKFLKETE